MQLWAETLTKRLKLTENIKSEDYFSSLCLVQYSQWKATNFSPGVWVGRWDLIAARLSSKIHG